jgi:delta(3,5)-delta(2,4)-dienoyl-CoA isomerase
MATDIATKSPVAVQVTKRSIVYSRDHTVQEGLDHIVST